MLSQIKRHQRAYILTDYCNLTIRVIYTFTVPPRPSKLPRDVILILKKISTLVHLQHSTGKNRRLQHGLFHQIQSEKPRCKPFGQP